MTLIYLIRAAGLVFIATSFIVFGDVAGKLLTAGGQNPLFIAWTRMALGAVLLAPFCGLRLSEVRLLLDWRLALRAVLITCAIFGMLSALKTEPIANVFGAFFLGPLVAYCLSVWILKETTSPARSLLLLCGFAGVLLVVKPGFGGSPGIGYAVFAGLCHGCYMVATRAFSGQFRPRLMLFSQLAIGTVLLAVPGLAGGIPSLDLSLSLLILASALCSAYGNYLLVIANKRIGGAVIAPLVYTQLVTATAVGILVFADWPDMWSLLGLTVILASGLGSLLLTFRAQPIPVATAGTK